MAQTAPAFFSVENVVKRFGGVTAVDTVSTAVGPSELVSIIGPNGAGKSTLLNIATGVMSPDDGRVVFGGKDITRLSSTARSRRGIGRTFQNIRLFKSLTVLETVAMGMHARERPTLAGMLGPWLLDRGRRARWWAAADEMLGLLGLEHYRDDEATTLPLGDQRRLEIARALIARPRLLFLDEPCAGMLTSELDDFAELLTRLRTEFEMAIVLIEHHIGLVLSVSDRIVILHDGSQVAEGTPVELQRTERLREVYLGE